MKSSSSRAFPKAIYCCCFVFFLLQLKLKIAFKMKFMNSQFTWSILDLFLSVSMQTLKLQDLLILHSTQLQYNEIQICGVKSLEI